MWIINKQRTSLWLETETCSWNNCNWNGRHWRQVLHIYHTNTQNLLTALGCCRCVIGIAPFGGIATVSGWLRLLLHQECISSNGLRRNSFGNQTHAVKVQNNCSNGQLRPCRKRTAYAFHGIFCTNCRVLEVRTKEALLTSIASKD